jgi:hypothetical protein
MNVFTVRLRNEIWESISNNYDVNAKVNTFLNICVLDASSPTKPGKKKMKLKNG